MNKSSSQDQIQTIIEKARPYENLIMNVVNIFLWKKLSVLVGSVLIFDALLLFAHFNNLGLFAFFFFTAAIFYLIAVLFLKFPSLKKIFQIQDVELTTKCTFDEVCTFIANLRQCYRKLLIYLLGSEIKSGFTRACYIELVWITIAIVSHYICRFWLIFFAINIGCFIPGYIFNPNYFSKNNSPTINIKINTQPTTDTENHSSDAENHSSDTENHSSDAENHSYEKNDDEVNPEIFITFKPDKPKNE